MAEPVENSEERLTMVIGQGPKPPFPERLADRRRLSEKTAPDGADRQTDRQTNRQTDGHCDLETESGRFSENCKTKKKKKTLLNSLCDQGRFFLY